jgi:UDP-2-acetamido-2,6-beta-L-arabino-hexul-4-ose reductase
VKTVLVTGSEGFIGKNLRVALSRLDDIRVIGFDIGDDFSSFTSNLKEADIIYHLAGVNRPESVEEFQTVNTGLTQTMVSLLEEANRKPIMVMTSSIQAELDNPYGISKKKAEDILLEFRRKTGVCIYIYRLTNVFGKWCRPNYNSVVATFCYNIANGLDINISDRNKELELVYIDDVVDSFMHILVVGKEPGSENFLTVQPTYKVTLGNLSDKIYELRDIRKTLIVPNFADRFTRSLYATYISYLQTDDFAYTLKQYVDQRGELAELVKSLHFGQIFVSRTRPGIVRGNHYHDTKVEKFAVLEGQAVIRFRHILGDDVIEYPIEGKNFRVVDIPPGYIHSIQNVGQTDLIVLFWANEIFEKSSSDTFPLNVVQGKQP